MLSALCWVPRGAAKAVPDRVQPSDEELRAMQAGKARDLSAESMVQVLRSKRRQSRVD